MAKKDYYKVLGIAKNATTAEIKTAFKKLARQYHPDVNPGKKEAEDKFKEVSEAYEVLGDEKKRHQYDQFGSFDFGGRGPQNPYSQQYWQNINFNDGDFDDIFGEIFGFGGPKRGRRAGRVNFDFGGGGSGFNNVSRDGTDINWLLAIEFLEAVNGCEKQILLSDGKRVKVKIPAGVDTGSKIRLSGKGNPGIASGRAGDLIIETKVNPHPHFERDGDDIFVGVDISLAEALRGAKVTVQTITGQVQLTVPKGAQSGQKMRLKGRGVANIKTKVCGNQIVQILVKYPSDLSDAEAEQIAKIVERHKSPTEILR